jgi:hypothetical protein
MVATSLNEANIALTMVGTGLRSAAKGSGLPRGKRSASLSPRKPRISSNFGGRQRGPGRGVRNKLDIAAGATSASDKPPAPMKKTRSGVKAANKAAGAMNVPDGLSGREGKAPASPAEQSAMLGAASPVQTCPQGNVDKSERPLGRSNVRVSMSRLRADADESVGYVSTGCKETGGARDSIIHNKDNNKDDNKEDKVNNKNKAEGSGDDPDKEDDAKLILLHREMDSLEHRMYSEGTVALVFARAVTQAQLAGQPFGDNAVASMAAIFEGSEKPNPCAVAAALEPDAANARAYLVVMNSKVGFTLLHHLQRVDQEIRPGDPIATKIVAFEGNIRLHGPTPNVVVFNKAKDTLIQRFNLPQACLVKTFAKYSSRTNGNNQHHTFVVDPAATARVTGAVTRMIPIPMEWASMFVDGPNFGTAFP